MAAVIQKLSYDIVLDAYRNKHLIIICGICLFGTGCDIRRDLKVFVIHGVVRPTQNTQQRALKLLLTMFRQIDT